MRYLHFYDLIIQKLRKYKSTIFNLIELVGSDNEECIPKNDKK